MTIPPIPPLPPTVPALGATAATTGSAGAGGFAATLGQAVAGLQSLQTQADGAAQQLANGQGSDLSTAVVAAEKANLGLELAVEVRNRAISAYQTIMQMQV